MSTTLSEKSYQYVRELLMRGEVAPGERLVTRNLADDIGVSLAPVREALNRLATEGLIEHIPGAGAFVRQADRQELEELYVLRDATESCAAAEAARYISSQQLEELDEIVGDWQQIASDIRQSTKRLATRKQLHRWLDLEEEFHEILIDASRNRLLARVIRDHRAVAAVFEAQRGDPSILTAEVAERTCNDRRELMAALHERDADKSRQLMSEQIRKGRKTVLNFLRRRRP